MFYGDIFVKKLPRSLKPFLVASLTGVWLLTACADPIEPEGEDEEQLEGDNQDPGAQSPLKVSTEGSVVNAQVDATSEEAWIPVDVDGAAAVLPEGDATWDVAFRRFAVKTRGGVSGTGGVEVAKWAEGVAFDAATQAPAVGWTVDAEGQPDPQNPMNIPGAPSNFFNQDPWWDYNPSTHLLSPSARVYAVRTDTGATFKVQFQGYYDSVGTPGHVSLRWAPVAQPATQALAVDATSTENWVYLKVGTGIVTVADPATSLDWDVAVRRTVWITNSGLSGSGQAGAVATESAEVRWLPAVPTEGFVVDAETTVQGAQGPSTVVQNPVLMGWYDYNPSTHAVTPKAKAFVLKTASGASAGLRIRSYASGQYAIELSGL